MSDGPRSLVLIIWGLDSMMSETVVAGWWPSFQLAHTLLPLLTSRPSLALWTLHEHHSHFFLIALLTFYTGIGALQCMYALFRSFVSLGPRGASFSLSFPIVASLHFITLHRLCHLSYLLLALHHFLPSPSGDHPQFITWRVVMSFPLSILRGLIQGSSVWEGHFVGESLCYFSIWEYVYPFFTSSWELLHLRSKHVHFLCMFKNKNKKMKWKKNDKKWKKWKKKKTHVCIIFYHWVCILMFEGHLIEYVCWWEFVCELSDTLHTLCSFYCIFWKQDEWPSLRSFGLLSLPSLRSLLMWLHSMSNLSLSLLLFVLFVSSSSSFSLLVLFFSYNNPSRVWYSLRIIITHITISSFCFICLIIDIIFTLGILRSIAHGIYYTCCISYMRAWVSNHWVFEPSFPLFLSPYHLGLRYVPCLKTTLRPWDQMSSSTASTWTGV